jgi:hypothetical protein
MVKILLGIILGSLFGSLGLVWALDLIDPSASEPIANASNDSETKEVAETNNQTGYFQNYDFPLDSCGDKNPGGSNVWYPVYIANTEQNFNSIRTNFCQDAIRKYRKEQQITSIQVSSFTDRSKAEEFASLMQNNLGSGEVGEPTVRDFSQQNISLSSQNSSKLNTYENNSSQKIQPFYANEEKYVYVANYGVTDVYDKRKELYNEGLYYAPSSVKKDGNIVTFKQAFQCISDCNSRIPAIRLTQYNCDPTNSIPYWRSLGYVNEQNNLMPIGGGNWGELSTYKEFGSEHPDAILYSQVCKFNWLF